MGRRLTSPVVCLIAGLAVTGSVGMQAQARQRSMYVSVLDEAGRPVLDVSPSDLSIREDGVPREILRIAAADEPMQIAVLVDDSEASGSYIRDYREALARFVTDVLAASPSQGRHQIALVGLASRPTIITDYTSDAARLKQGIDRIFAQTRTGTYLLDAIVEVTRGLMRRQAARPVLVALVTEGPEFSPLQYEEVLGSLRTAAAPFHVLSLGYPSNPSAERTIVLERGAAESGGQRDVLLAATALTGRMARLAAELTQQHRVVYARPQSLIPPDRVAVAAARPGLTVRGAVAAALDGQDRP